MKANKKKEMKPASNHLFAKLVQANINLSELKKLEYLIEELKSIQAASCINSLPEHLQREEQIVVHSVISQVTTILGAANHG